MRFNRSFASMSGKWSPKTVMGARRIGLLCVPALVLGGCSPPTPTMPVETFTAALVPTTARWIWASEDFANEWVAFRKKITVAAKPTSAVTQIAADTKYWLYVNGNLVTFEGGLKGAPNPNDTYYDEKDLAPFMTSGTNTIAILTWHYGISSEGHKDSGAAGLLFQSDVVVNGTSTRINSDASWKARRHPGYGQDPGGHSNPSLSESSIYYDAGQAGGMVNWTTPSYNDTAWAAAWDRAAAGAAPWNALVQRPIPFFKVSALQDYTNAAPTIGRSATPIVMTLPSNIQVTPYLRVRVPANSPAFPITIQTDHYNDGSTPNIRATYIPAVGSQPADQEFEALAWMSGRNVQYTIPATYQIISLRYRESGYATEFTGSFSSTDSHNDGYFNQLWQKSARTIYLNMRDGYSDCPTRERAQWWGDVVNEQKGGFYAFDTNSYALGKKAIAELVNWQRPTGVLYSPVPGVGTPELPAQMLASIYFFWTYYLYTGDATAVNLVYDHVKTYLNLWTFDANGIPDDRAGDWDWFDWGPNIDTRLLETVWYHLAVESAQNLASLTGHTADIGAWQARRNAISLHFDSVFWNATNKEYRSPGYTGDTDERGNALAVVAGLVDPLKRGAITEVLRVHQNASPYMELYALEALYLLDNAAGAEARMRARYAPEVTDARPTLWEFFDLSGTDNHGWNAGPLYVLSAYAAGVRPTSPGYATYQVRPQIGNQTRIDAVVPTVKGNISVTINKLSATHLTLALTSPANTVATVAIPRLGIVGSTITVNGSLIYQNQTPFIGPAGTSYAAQDLDYLYFTVTGGTWTFDETGSSGVFCSNENALCSFNGVLQVRYGSGSSYFNAFGNGGYPCTNQAFNGDPLYGVAKQCTVLPPSIDGGPVGYTVCANEGFACSPAGTAVVAYGAYQAFNFKTVTGSIPCNNATFADPANNIPKNCFSAPLPPNNGWVQCAIENGTCSFPGMRTVAFGANGAFLFKIATARATCDNATFNGDPIGGVPKTCYFR